MKKVLLAFFASIALLLSNDVLAVSNTELFTIDEAVLEETFAPIQELEQIVASNPTADLNFVQHNYAAAMNAVNLLDEALSLTKPMEDRPVAGISSYLWGACLGIAGILIVYFVLDDASPAFRKKETNHAIVGCAISAAVWTVLYFTVLGTAFL